MTDDTAPDQPLPDDADPETSADGAVVATLVPLSIGTVPTVEVDGAPWILFRPTVEAIGMDYQSQLQRLRRRSWATVVITPAIAADGKARQMVALDLRSFLGWAMTIAETRGRADVRPALVAFQRETLDAVEAYWTRGLAVNPRGRTPEEVALLERVATQTPTLLGLSHLGHVNRQIIDGRRDGDRTVARRRADAAARKMHELLTGVMLNDVAALAALDEAASDA